MVSPRIMVKSGDKRETARANCGVAGDSMSRPPSTAKAKAGWGGGSGSANAADPKASELANAANSKAVDRINDTAIALMANPKKK